MRTKLIGFSLVCLLAPAGLAAQQASNNLQLKEGVITIRALADRQRKLEEAEFFNRLNPNKSQGLQSAPRGDATQVGLGGQGGLLDASGIPMGAPGGTPNGAAIPPVQELPAIRSGSSVPSTQSIQVQEVERPMPANTVLSVYGPEGKLTAEVAMKNGVIAQFQVGDFWSGYRISQISRDGVSVLKAKGEAPARLIPVGGRL